MYKYVLGDGDMRTANPVFRSIEKKETYALDESASYRGIILKTSLLLLTAVTSGFFAINFIGDLLGPVIIGSFIVGFISVILINFMPRFGMVFGLTYALSEGVILGLITYVFEAAYQGIAFAAILSTLTVFGVMLFLYSSGFIRVTSRMRRIVSTILFSFLVFFIIFGILSMSFEGLFTSPGLILGVSAVMVVFGAIMLTIDFDNAQRIVDSEADKVYEWVVAVGLMVTLVWIYIEMIRILAIVASKRN